MERRDFFKASVAGVAVGLVACGDDSAQVSSPRFPASVRPRTSTDDNARRAVLSQLEFPPEDWESGLALMYLGEDVLRDPSVADRFVADPGAYIASLGLKDATLSRNSAEVATVLSFATAAVSAPLLRGDIGDAVAAMEAHDAFDPSRQSEFARNGETALQADVKAALAGEDLAPPAQLSAEARQVTDLAMAAVARLQVYQNQDALTDAQVKVLIERALDRYGVA